MASVSMEDGVPVSDAYGDVYFSKAGALEESHYVFMQGNSLPERFAKVQKSFTVAETGFGTGLNMLLCWQLWNQVAPKDAVLHYLSIEKHPLPRNVLESIYAQWPPLTALSRQWLNAYPLPVAGAHDVWLAGGRLRVTLLYGDMADMLPLIKDRRVDSWLLDGFAPAKNPDMWHGAHLHHIARCTAHDGSFSTFTAARLVRDGLTDAGFAVERVKGYGHKRHMLIGRMVKTPDITRSVQTQDDVVVVGAGIAGAACAWACAMRGLKVTVIDRHEKPACESSGNPAGILYPFMARKMDAATAFYLRGMAHTVRLLPQVGALHDLCGMEHRPKDPTHPDGIRNLQDVAQYLPNAIAYSTPEGMVMPHSGWVDVPSLCEAMLSHHAITCLYEQSVAHVAYVDGLWQVYDGNGQVIASARNIVMANAYDARQLWPAHMLPMRRIRGQITYVPEHYLQDVVQVYCYGGYITPAIDGVHYVGATFDKDCYDEAMNLADHEQNLARLQQSYPDCIKEWPSLSALDGRVAFRTVSGDRMPVVGRLYDAQAWQQMVASTPYTKRAAESLETPLLKGSYVTIAHGARGLVSAPLAGDMIAASIAQDTVATPAHETTLLSPIRFALRQWRKGH